VPLIRPVVPCAKLFIEKISREKIKVSQDFLN